MKNDPAVFGYTFREATAADIPAMKVIRDNVGENSLVGKSIEVDDYRQALFQDGKGWVCLYDNEVIGFSCGRLKQADVWALFIRKDHEGRGVGNKLMEMLEVWMFSQGCAEIVLSTWPGTRAEKLYCRREWEYEGILKNGEAAFRLKSAGRFKTVSANEKLVRTFWQFFSDQKWADAQLLLAPGFFAHWPQSHERIKGPDNFIELNRNYPGNHKIAVIHATEIGNQVITTVWIAADTGQRTFANSYFTIENGKIARVEEYWAEPYPAPEWRRKWVEVYD